MDFELVYWVGPNLILTDLSAIKYLPFIASCLRATVVCALAAARTDARVTRESGKYELSARRMVRIQFEIQLKNIYTRFA